MTRHRHQLLAAVTAAAALLAGCGGSNSPRSSDAPDTDAHVTQAQFQQDTLNFATCMRSHGVPSFPDPTSPHQFKFSLSPSAGGNQQSPAFQSAMTACQHLLPGGGPRNQTQAPNHAQLAALLAFASCLRSHGFPNFPDPSSGGQLTHEMLAAAGIDLHQPAVVQAAAACVSVTHGVITRAIVAKFIAGS